MTKSWEPSEPHPAGARRAIRGDVLAGPDSGTVTGDCRTPETWTAGAILVAHDLKPSMYGLLRDSRAVICSSGGLAGHMAAICRAKGITVIRVSPGDLDAITGPVRIDRALGRIDRGALNPADTVVDPYSGPTPHGSTCAVVSGSKDVVLANDLGWGPKIDQFFVREEFLCLEAGLSPIDLLAEGDGGRDHYATQIAARLTAMIGTLEPHQKIIYRLLDLRSDDASNISRNVRIGAEPNPELGMHGTRWIVNSVAYQALVKAVVRRLTRQVGDLWSHLELAGPFVTDGNEFARLRAVLDLPAGARLSAFVETPAGVYEVPAIHRSGAAEIFVGTKDLVQLFMAADRGNHRVADKYDTRHPAVLDALARVIVTCNRIGAPVRVFSFAKDLEYYLNRLPGPTGYMLDTAELVTTLNSRTLLAG